MKFRTPAICAAATLTTLGLIGGPSMARPGNAAQKAVTEGFDWSEDGAPEGYEDAIRLSNGNVVAFDAHEQTEHRQGQSTRIRPAKGNLLQSNAAGTREFVVDVQCDFLPGGALAVPEGDRVVLDPDGGALGLRGEDQADGGDLYTFCPQGAPMFADVGTADEGARMAFAGCEVKLVAARGDGFYVVDAEIDNRATDHRVRLLLDLPEPAASTTALRAADTRAARSAVDPASAFPPSSSAGPSSVETSTASSYRATTSARRTSPGSGTGSGTSRTTMLR